MRRLGRSGTDLIVKKGRHERRSQSARNRRKDIKYKKASHLDGPTYLVSVANVVTSASRTVRPTSSRRRITTVWRPRRRIPHRRNSRSDPRRALSRDVTSRATISTRTACGASSSRSTPKGHGIVMSIAQANLRWCESRRATPCGWVSTTNTTERSTRPPSPAWPTKEKVRWEDYPAFKWCRDLGEGVVSARDQRGAAHRPSLQQRPHKVRPQGPRTVQQPAERARRSEDGPADVLFLLDRRRRRMDSHDDPMGIEPPFVEQTSKNISFLVRAMHKF